MRVKLQHPWNATALAWIAFCLFLARPTQGEQIVFSEIMYHPRGAQPEYIELYNNTATPFDICQWQLTDGVRYDFPNFDPANPTAGFLKPFERIVLSAAAPADTRAAYGIPDFIRVYGPWIGDLNNTGERITVVDKNGLALCTVQFSDGGNWPVAADGAGHSLVLRNPNLTVDDWRNWTASARPGGTPGTEPAASAETPVTNPEVNLSQGIALVDYGDTWKFNDQALDLGTDWIAPGYDDSGWPQGSGLFGFETASVPAPGIRTSFSNARQLTYYLRKQVNYSGSLQGAVITVDQVLDDGAVYYLNGREIGRSGMAGGTPAFTSTANRTVGDAAEELNVLTVDGSQLVNGRNSLAVEVHQVNTTSSDLVFGMRLNVSVPVQSQSGIVINEVLPGPAGKGFIEFYNPGRTAVNLLGFHLTDRTENLVQHRIANELIVPAGGYASVGFAESGLSPSDAVVVYLVSANGSTIETAIRSFIPLDGRALGRKPAGSASWFLFTEPTRNAPNTSQDSASAQVTLNEIHFSPSQTVDWIELFNAGSTPTDLNGLFLSARRDFSDRMPLAGAVSGGGFLSWDTAFPVAGGDVTVYLINAAFTVLDCRTFTRMPSRDSCQAFPDGTAEWYASPTATRNAVNSPPQQTDIVINEIMFYPPSDELEGEFIELFNRGAATVDVSGWRFADGPNFTLPQGTLIAPGGYLVCAANASRLRAVYGNVPVVGDFEGRLANRGERVRLVDQFGNLVDQVDYTFGGDWPELAHGSGSSLELVNPWMDNSLPSAWRDSDESGKSSFQTFTVTDTYRQLNSLGGVTDYKELHFFLANDGYAVVRNIALRHSPTAPNLVVNGTVQSTTGSGANGWLCQGTHAASFIDNGQLHLIADGHGDNRANRAEIDITGIQANSTVTLTFDARWLHGSPRLIAQTWDHSVGAAFRLPIPENLGTPGTANSRHEPIAPPQVDALRHSPAVPKSTEDVTVTARVLGITPISSVRLFHRVDNANGNAVWANKLMFDDGVSGGDTTAGDGVYTAVLTEHKASGRIVQFYVQAASANAQDRQLPVPGAARPAMYVVDDRAIPRDLRSARFIVSAYDLDAIANGETARHQFKYPRLSNHYKNMTFISNEEEVRYGGLIRNSGSPWTRGGDLSRGKWKLPEDRSFRSHVKFTFDNDPTSGRMHHNRIARYMLYLLGHPVGENEFIRVMINSSSPALREDNEAVAKDMMDRIFENGREGELYRIDDEWWFRDSWDRTSRDADWSYKNSENPVRYHTEWMKRTGEDDYDYSALINLFRTVSTTSYSQEQIERLVDAEATLQMAAVRGYIGDWDSFTLNRGKNGYTYRRWDDGKFMFLHWDSDLAFQNSNEVLYNSGRPGIGSYITKPYNLRRFYYYLTELLDQYTLNSPRMNAWLQAEEAASGSFSVAASTYRNWFSSRLSYCRNRMGANYTRPFEITTHAGPPIQTSDATLTLTGAAPYTVFEVEVENHPEGVAVWNDLIGWTVTGIRLRQGQQQLNVRGLDQWGRVIHQSVVSVNKSGNAPPTLALQADPPSWNVGLAETLQLDARDSFDPEGTALSYRWTVSPAPAAFTTNQIGRATASFRYPGLYTFSVQAADAIGQSASLSREAAVYGPNGFSSFLGARLEDFWNLANVNVRGNNPGGAWLSLTDKPGWLTMQVLDDMERPLARPASPYPLLWRTLPDGREWVLQTKLRLGSRQFGNYMTGLQIEALESGSNRRYVFGIENGTTLTAKRFDPSGAVTVLASPVSRLEEIVIRLRRSGEILFFEEDKDGAWTTVIAHHLDAGTTTGRGGLFLSTALPESIRVHFDYALLIDPGNRSELREALRISEVMFNPVGGEQFEFIELMNIGAAPLELGGCQFVEGIAFIFGATTLAPGQRIVVVSDATAFSSRYGTNGVHLAGTYTGRLDNAGERLTLADPNGQTILSFAYDDSGDWPGRADGLGSSLEVLDPQANYDEPGNWVSSAEYLGSPGRVGVGKLASVVINEVLTHADPPLEDAIELCNPTAQPIDISGWFLSDAGADLTKFRIPAGTVLAAGGYKVFYQSQFDLTNSPPNVPFSLNSYLGDEVWLTAADAQGHPTFFVDKIDFGAAENAVPFGRYPNGTGPLVSMSRRTFGADDPRSPAEFQTGTGAANAYPKVGPVVISQIMYHPASGGEEYIELRNLTAASVPLFDPEHPTNSWRLANAVDFIFPMHVVLAPNANLLVAPSDPAVFRARMALPAETPVFGPWSGALDNAGERVELLKPDPPTATPPDIGFVPFILVDAVRYNNHEPWPALADGFGPALHRLVPSNYGNDPANWHTDFDDDSIPDDWESAHGLSPYDPADAHADPDGDGFTSLEEYHQGTDPRAPDHPLAISAVRLEAGYLVFEFVAAAGQGYSVQARDYISQGAWTETMKVPSEATTRTARISLPILTTAGQRFYRLHLLDPN